MRKIPIVFLGIVLVLAGCSAASGPARTLEVRAANMAFEPREITLAKGQPVKIVFSNTDSLLHDWAVDKLPAKGIKTKGDDHGHEKGTSMHVAADAGGSGSIEFTPTKSGTYAVICTVPGHKEAGMIGTLIVN